MTQRYEATEICPECKSRSVIHDEIRGETSCCLCGLVIDTLAYADGSDAYAFDGNGILQNHADSKGRLGSTIGYAKGMSAYNRSRFARMRLIQKRQTAGTDRALKGARAELSRICAVNQIPGTVRDFAEGVYIKAAKKRMIKGRTVRHVLGVGIYEGCRKYGFPRTLDSVAMMCGVSRRELGRDVRFLGKGLSLNRNLLGAESYVDPLSRGLGMDCDTVNLAKRLASDSKNAQAMSGKSPVSIAAASIYLAAMKKNCRIPQSQISKVTGVSCPTIKRVSLDIERSLLV